MTRAKRIEVAAVLKETFASAVAASTSISSVGTLTFEYGSAGFAAKSKKKSSRGKWVGRRVTPPEDEEWLGDGDVWGMTEDDIW